MNGTPMVNGYKIIAETPKYFKVPATPLREELGLQMANSYDQKKRLQKKQEKETKVNKLKCATPLANLNS